MTTYDARGHGRQKDTRRSIEARNTRSTCCRRSSSRRSCRMTGHRRRSRRLSGRPQPARSATAGSLCPKWAQRSGSATARRTRKRSYAVPRECDDSSQLFAIRFGSARTLATAGMPALPIEIFDGCDTSGRKCETVPKMAFESSGRSAATDGEPCGSVSSLRGVPYHVPRRA